MKAKILILLLLISCGAWGQNYWQHSQYPYSKYQYWTYDTLKTNNVDPPTKAMPLSGLFARRTMYYNDGIFTTQKIYGHYFGQTFNWKDSMRFRTEGGDYNQAVTIEQRLKPRGTGPQRTGHNGTGNNNNAYYGVPSLLVNTYLDNSGGLNDGSTNTIHTYGWITGISSYFVAGALDTVERFSFIQTNSFISGSTRVKKFYGLDFQHHLAQPAVDSSWGLWDQYGYRHYLRGKTIIGAGDSTVTDYQFKVTGATYHKGLVQNNQGADVASTAGVMTLGADGNVFEITGTNTITAIANTNKKNGYVVTLLFTSTATLTDGTANSGANIGMELEGNTNFTGSADDAVTLVLSEIGGVQRWRMIGKSVN